MVFFVFVFASLTSADAALGVAALGVAAFAGVVVEPCAVGATAVMGFGSCCGTWEALGVAGPFAASAVELTCAAGFSEGVDCAGATGFAADVSSPHAPSTRLAHKLAIDTLQMVAIEGR